jgi:D-alanyl-D-alanine dipeptidase
VDPTILVDIRYQTPHNFVGRPIDGYLEPVCLLPERTAQALRRVQVAARAEGYSLKVYECFRPLRATADFVRWRETTDETMRAEFYPTLTKRELFSRGFIASSRSKHSGGNAVDVTLVRVPAAAQRPFAPGEPLVACTAPVGERFADNSIDMGTGFDCFDARSHTSDAGIGPQAQENRARLRRLMARGGFANYANEWWHYELAGSARYFDFPVARAVLT